MAEQFRAKAAYLGGHPQATRARIGHLSLEGTVLRWTPKGKPGADLKIERSGLLPSVRWAKREDEPFTIDVATVNSVEFKGDADLKKAPSGYVKSLPFVAHGYGGSQAKHPMGSGRLKKMLIIKYMDGGHEYEVFFANEPGAFGFGPLAQDASDRGGYELASKIIAARATAGPKSGGEPPREATTDAAGRLRTLKQLHDDGLVTDDEYAAKRSELLDHL